jgi:hypothetical protein
MPFFLAHPAAAWLFPAVALPLLFHLFFRLRKQVRDFPSLMFFLRIDPRLSAKRKIHEWLILLLRTLFLALLLLALVRPMLGTRGTGGPVARLVLIDNSGSMAAPVSAGLSKLTLAGRATQRLIDASRAGDQIAVQLMIPDPTDPLPHGFDAPPALLRDAVGKISPSDGAASVSKAIRAALATLDTAKPTRRELHILTDLQHDNWSRGELAGEAQVLHCDIIVHRIASAPLTAGSVSLEPVDGPTRSIPAGRVTPVRIVLQNHGPAAAHVRLNSADDSGKNIARDLDLAPKGTAPVTLTFSFGSPGFHWAQVWVEGDAAPTANRAAIGFWCTEAQQALLVGAKADFAALPYAIAPGGNADLSGIDAVFIGADQLLAHLATQPLAVVVTWEKMPQDAATTQALQAYVRAGGTLVIVPSPETGITVAPPVAPWLDASPGALYSSTEAAPMILLREGDALWENLRDTDGRPKLGQLRALHYRPVKTGPDWQALITSANGATLFARRTLGQGHIFVSGLAFTPKWSSLPLHAGFVVLMQNAVFGDQAETTPVRQMKAAEDFHFDLLSAPATVKSLAGNALDWQGLARDFEGFPRAGVYALTQNEHSTWIAVSGNVDEANSDFLPLAPVPLLHGLTPEVLPLVQENDILRASTSPTTGTSLYRWLVLVALLLLLAETWLANGRSSDLGRKLFQSMKVPVSAPKKAKELSKA